MKVLAVREPYATLIADGYKDLEIRNYDAQQRGYICIYSTKAKPCDSQLLQDVQNICSLMDDYDIDHEIPHRLYAKSQENRGRIIAVGYLGCSMQFQDWDHFEKRTPHHLNVPSQYQDGVYGWHIKDVCKFNVSINHRYRGSVIWDNINVSEINDHIKQYEQMDYIPEVLTNQKSMFL